MVLEDKSYVPTLAVRASEMNGLEYLPGATKNLMTPCFLLAPWANSNSLDRTVDRIERAFPNRAYFLDIDRDYALTNLENGPQRDLAQLLLPDDNFANWVAFVGQHEYAMPCIQTAGQSEAQIRAQIGEFQRLGRPYSMRIVLDRFPSNLHEIINAFSASGAADFAIILEGGWTRDPLTLAAWFAGIVGGALDVIDASVPIVLSCTSIPKMFNEFSADNPSIVEFTNRILVEQVSRSSNRARVIYGDWGSTRPREPKGFASRPLDRIDYPSIDTWYVARNKEKGWDFRDAAEVIVNSWFWEGNLGIWGEEMIEQTSINKVLGIDTPQKNVAARVNIHLHRQAFFGRPLIGRADFDEDWED